MFLAPYSENDINYFHYFSLALVEFSILIFIYLRFSAL